MLWFLQGENCFGPSSSSEDNKFVKCFVFSKLILKIPDSITAFIPATGSFKTEFWFQVEIEDILWTVRVVHLWFNICGRILGTDQWWSHKKHCYDQSHKSHNHLSASNHHADWRKAKRRLANWILQLYWCTLYSCTHILYQKEHYYKIKNVVLNNKYRHFTWLRIIAVNADGK